MTAATSIPVPLAPPSVRRTVTLLTPEGVLLPFEIATAGERLAAYLTDLVIQWTLLLVFWIFLAWVSGGGDWLLAVGLLLSFVVMNGWFLAFELGPRAATPGKRWFGLRVMDAGGGVLTPGAVAARNLMRNLELHVPLALVLDPEALGWGTSGWVRLLLVLWAFVLAGLPLFNRLRLRPGDLVGGTLVVVTPKPALLAELTTAASRPAETRFLFTPAQLSVYGVYELQVLEDLLRRERVGPDPDPLPAVAARIAKKIRWGADLSPREAPPFLRAFYAALRRHLEERLLLGKRKDDKRSKER